jgi:hypothetical protein
MDFSTVQKTKGSSKKDGPGIKKFIVSIGFQA